MHVAIPLISNMISRLAINGLFSNVTTLIWLKFKQRMNKRTVDAAIAVAIPIQKNTNLIRFRFMMARDVQKFLISFMNVKHSFQILLPQKKEGKFKRTTF